MGWSSLKLTGSFPFRWAVEMIECFLCECVCLFGIMALCIFICNLCEKIIFFPLNVLNSVYSFVPFHLITLLICVQLYYVLQNVHFFIWCSHFIFFFLCISFNANCVDTLFKPNYTDICDGRGTWLAKKETGNGGEKIQIERKKSPGHHTKH